MEDCVDRVGLAKHVTKLDLLKGYWQVPLSQRASEISAFVSPNCFLQYKVLAFGMRNAPATFQRLMHQILSDVTNCEVYVDGIVFLPCRGLLLLVCLNQGCSTLFLEIYLPAEFSSNPDQTHLNQLIGT
ncbi:Retrovirus-related Pol polyprotein [Labeo rohita]|uniref:ribonuclease H n=1 Tax=Labeo rohita TaxID=84645 RepID=A0ABQ8LAQ6_LABRO|nr:Retrovirus-related Pol polyprotein [Labeo rohita]